MFAVTTNNGPVIVPPVAGPLRVRTPAPVRIIPVAAAGGDRGLGPSRTRIRIATTLALALVWLAALFYVGLVAVRFLAFDKNRFFAAFNAQTLWLFLPAYAIASAAWCFRRFGLALVMTIVVVFHVATIVPSAGPADPIPAAARRAPRLRVVTANVRFTNAEPEKLAGELLEADADVVFLQELTPPMVRVLVAAGYEQRYPFFTLSSNKVPRGLGIYSRFPLHDVDVLRRGLNPVLIAQIDVGRVHLSLVNVHLVSPPHGMRAHRASAALAETAVREQPPPRVVAGDFNATPYNKTMHQMRDLGLESAQQRGGHGLVPTWPNGAHLSLPVQVDHVLVDDALVVLDVRELRGSGSDHRPVLVDLAVMQAGGVAGGVVSARRSR